MDPTVAAAVVAAVPATLVAIATWRKIGSPNGHGTLTAMMGHALEELGAVRAEQTAVRERLNRLEEITVSQRLDALEKDTE